MKSAAAPSTTQEESMGEGLEDHPYATLEAEQRKRELQWKSQRATKKAKTKDPAVHQTAAIPKEPSEIITIIEKAVDQAVHQADQVSDLKKQLEAKSQECAHLKRQLEMSEKTREVDADQWGYFPG